MWAWAMAGVLVLAGAPKELTQNEEKSFYLRAEAPVVLADELLEETALTAPLRRALDAEPRIIPASQADKLDGAIVAGTLVHPGALSKRKYRKVLEDLAPLGEEGYQIRVNKDGIAVAGGGIRGLIYGLHALADLVEEHDANLPHLELRDWPTLAVRGAILRTAPDERDFEMLSALRCTHLFFESEAFYRLSGVEGARWREVFEQARAHHMEPIPIFSTLDGLEGVLRERPMMIEGRGVTDRVTLRGEEWAALRYPNIIAEHPEDVSVNISGVACVPGRDFEIEAQPLVAPFSRERLPWRIRRMPGGSIPDGAQVECRYSFATEDSASLCFAAPESRVWLRESLNDLITTLEPRYIHLDHGAAGRLNTDLRSRAFGLSNSEAFAQSLALVAGLARERDPQLKFMVWADLLNPGQGAGMLDLAVILPSDDVIVLGRVGAATPGDGRARLAELLPILSRPAIVAVQGPPAVAMALQTPLQQQGGVGAGIVADGVNLEEARGLLERAWGGSHTPGIWPRLLNDFFDAALEQPALPEVRGVLADYLNREALAGNSPADARRRFTSFAGSQPEVLKAEDPSFVLVQTLLDLMVDFLELEAATANGSALDSGELQRIKMGVNQLEGGARMQALFGAPESPERFPSVLEIFLADLRYYRFERPTLPVYNVPLAPVTERLAGEFIVTLPLGEGQAPLRRFEIEAAGLPEVALFSANAEGALREEARWVARGPVGVRGALLPETPVSAATFVLKAPASSDTAILDGVWAYGEKPLPILECAYAPADPPVEPGFGVRPWSGAPWAGAFLQRDIRQFAGAPTAVRAVLTRGNLWVGVTAAEPEPAAIVADFQGHDAPLWEQESIEVWIQPEGELPKRLVVSPLGARYDSEAGDGGWDGDWSATARVTGTGWGVVFRIPSELAGEPKRGDTLRFNLVRNRRAGVEETSVWAHTYGAQPEVQWGELRFP